jgi:serine phosphatase RsbU (regulator of sigma subunit)
LTRDIPLNTPHVQLVLDQTAVPPHLQTALNRLKARVSVHSINKVLADGISPSADVCVILPGHDESMDVLDRITADASDQACATMILPLRGTQPIYNAMHRVPVVDHSIDTMSAEELTGRIRALFEARIPMQRMRNELNRLRQRDAEMSVGVREREEQLRLASQIQLDLLPSPLADTDPLEVSTLFLPADHISGDIYEIARLDENCFGFSLADATGHGLPAALLTVLIKNCFRGKEIVNGSYRIIEPDELLTRLNHELINSGLSHCQFITGIHAIYDRNTNQIRWARAGAPYPILLRPGESPRQLQSAGGLMGALEDQTFETAQHELQRDDVLLFYTDGLENLLLGKQGCGSEGAILQSPWLNELATDGPDAALAEIKELAASLKPTDWPHDDITAIALRLT